MRANLSLKTLYRSPVRTVLTFILLVAVTFALFSQLMEYSVAKREMDKMVDTYQGVGVVENGVFVSALNSVPAYMYSDPRVPQGLIPDEIYSAYRKLGYEHFPAEAMNAMLDLPNITYADTRYMTAGVTEYRRVDEGLGYYDYTNICVMEGTISNYNDRMGSLIVTDVKLIGGEAISNTEYEEYGIYVAPEPNIMLEQSATPVCYRKVNNRAVTTATENSLYTLEFIQSLEIGQRYVFILRYEDDFIIKPDIGTYYLTDPFIYGKYDAVYPLAGEPENYIDTEKFAPLREYIEIVETDQYTLDVVYTTNMESIRYFAEKKIGISEGRPLTNKDTKKREDVCVINNYLAYKYDLAVGDKITVNLGNKLFSQNHGVGAVAAVSERASTEFTTVELEIVGIFMDTRNKYSVAEYNEAVWSYGANTIFVPQHLLNVSDEELENHTFHSGEVSFVVEDAWDIPQFIEQSVPLVEEMGYSMKFDDGGFMDIYEALVETERIAYIKISVLLFAIVVVTWFIAMLFVVGRRQDYAIMRLLGTAKPDAAKTLLLPLTVIAAVAVIVGTVSAYISTVQNIADSQYLSVVTGVEIDLSISPWVVIGCVAGELMLTLLLALLLISIIGRKSPLELMQSANRQRREKRRRKKEQTADSGAVVVLGEWKSIERPHTDGKSRSAAFVMRYIFRHIRRTGGKALLFVFVAVLLINVLGQLIIMRESYIEIFESTEVTADFTGYLSLKYVDELIKSGYVKDVYYYTNRNVSINRSRAGTTVTFCCDLELYAKSKGVENLNITWLEGYDASSMHGLSNVIVIGEDHMMKYGYELGETLEISRENEYQAVTNKIVNKLRVSDKKYATYTNEELAEIKQDEIMEIYSKNMDEFTIIGVIHGIFVEELFAPGSPKASADFGSLIIPPYVTAVVADNYKAEEFREFAEEIAYINRYSDVVFIMNTAKIENVKNNIDLLKTLYPIMVAAVLIIGAFLCGLIIVQTSKDIAIMRVLGTSKAKTRTILVLEQMILCVVGVIISGVVLYLRGVFMQMLWVFGAYTLVILVSAIVASIAASRKNVLELLQTKE